MNAMPMNGSRAYHVMSMGTTSCPRAKAGHELHAQLTEAGRTTSCPRTKTGHELHAHRLEVGHTTSCPWTKTGHELILGVDPILCEKGQKNVSSKSNAVFVSAAVQHRGHKVRSLKAASKSLHPNNNKVTWCPRDLPACAIIPQR